MTFIQLQTTLLLAGCGQKPRENKTEVIVDDIIITNPNPAYYTRQDNTLYPSNDALVICGYNEYKCINATMEYDEESGKYICIIEFKKIIDNE